MKFFKNIFSTAEKSNHSLFLSNSLIKPFYTGFAYFYEDKNIEAVDQNGFIGRTKDDTYVMNYIASGKGQPSGFSGFININDAIKFANEKYSPKKQGAIYGAYISKPILNINAFNHSAKISNVNSKANEILVPEISINELYLKLAQEDFVNFINGDKVKNRLKNYPEYITKKDLLDTRKIIAWAANQDSPNSSKLITHILSVDKTLQEDLRSHPELMEKIINLVKHLPLDIENIIKKEKHLLTLTK
jgi:hypothetical protein